VKGERGGMVVSMRAGMVRICEFLCNILVSESMAWSSGVIPGELTR
jgi:hypothetical protein